MTSLLFRISISALLSVASLLIILFRVSPLQSPGIALPFFFLTLFLCVTTAGCLLFYVIWGLIQVEGMDAGRKLTVSLREGVLLALATVLLIVFLILDVLTWWIGALIYLVFLFIELALLS